MSDQVEDRAERALRDAFAERADALETVPLDVEPARRARWGVALVAAAAVLVLGVGSVVVVRAIGGTGGDDPDAARSAAIGETREVSYRDVVVDVPADWPDEAVPEPWCLDLDASNPPTEPYVRVRVASPKVPTAACGSDTDLAFGQGRKEYWRPFLALGPAGPDDAVETDGEWTSTTRTVGSAQLHLVTDAATRGLTDAILGSARVVSEDGNGCESYSLVQNLNLSPRPADLDEIGSVSAVSVCQYDRTAFEEGGDAEPGLAGSRRVTGAAAQRLLAGLRDAPLGGGPDPGVRCGLEVVAPQALVVRFFRGDRGVGQAYVYYDGCIRNGIDDGVDRRALTQDACAPLFGGRVQRSIASGPPDAFVAFDLCD